MEFIEQLLSFGLTRQEAVIYSCLLENGEQTGYEVAKITGISRSNTYNALAGLVEKGAAFAIEGAGTKYIPVNVKDFSNNIIRNLSKLQKALLLNAPQQTAKSDAYITIKGEKHIYNQLENMIERVEQRLYLSASKEVLKKLTVLLDETSRKGIKTVVITDDATFKKENFIVYYSDTEISQTGVIIDSREVLTGDLEGKDRATCLYTKNNNFVDVYKEMLSNKIKLLELQGGLRQ